MFAAASAFVEDDSKLNSKDGIDRSQTGSALNREFRRDVAEGRLRTDFFQCVLSAPLFPESEFYLTFRIPRILHERIRCEVSEINCFFPQNTGATEKPGASTDLKIYTALLMLGEGRSFLSIVQHLRMIEPFCMECVKQLTKPIMRLFQSEWFWYLIISEID